MSQLNSQIRRAGGDMDVYTGLLAAATLVLLLGVVALMMGNSDHSTVSGPGGGQPGGPFSVVADR